MPRWRRASVLAAATAFGAPASVAARKSGCPTATQDSAVRLRAEIDSLRAAGNLDRAIERARCLLDVGTALFGPTHPSTVNIRHDLAELLRQANRNADAERVEPADQGAAARSTPAADLTMVNQTLVRVKSLLDRGDTEGAAREALAAKRLALKSGLENSLTYAAVLNEGGRVMERLGNTEEAADLYRQSSKLAGQFGEAGRTEQAIALNNLGLLYSRLGKHKEALTTLEEALRREKKDDDESAPTKLNLGRAYEAVGRHAEARKILLAARDQVLRAYGDSHPVLRGIYVSLTTQSWKAGRLAEAVGWQEKVNDVVERNARETLLLGSERQKLAYMADSQHTVDASVDLCLDFRNRNMQAGRMAFGAVLQRKGRVLAAYAAALDRLRRRASQVDATLWQKFVDYQRHRSEAMLAGASSTAGAREADDTTFEALLERVGSADAADEDLFSAVTIEQVRAALPPRSALVEFVAYTPQGPNRSRSVRYAAFALSPTQGLTWAPLGDGAAVVAGVRDLRAALANPDSTTVDPLARKLYGLILAPLEQQLRNVDRLFVSPDGALTLLPIGALIDRDGHYLVDRFVVDYLTSGRSLIGSEHPPREGSAPMIVADPAFGPCGQTAAPACITTGRSALGTRTGVGRLCATRTEASAIGRLLPGAALLEDQDATEAAVKQARSPRVLHLATHGFFGLDVVNAIDACAGGPPGKAAVAGPSRPDDGLLHSGLVLAGANQRRSGGDDGLLTAAEVTTMDLTGTELVVLSACETGLGEMVLGEGLFGLRRAFELAGAASLIMSLWSVADTSTADLMVTFYQSLLEDNPRGRRGVPDALTAAQRWMLHDEKQGHTHPYYWAPFIASGRWSPTALKTR